MVLRLVQSVRVLYLVLTMIAIHAFLHFSFKTITEETDIYSSLSGEEKYFKAREALREGRVGFSKKLIQVNLEKKEALIPSLGLLAEIYTKEHEFAKAKKIYAHLIAKTYSRKLLEKDSKKVFQFVKTQVEGHNPPSSQVLGLLYSLGLLHLKEGETNMAIKYFYINYKFGHHKREMSYLIRSLQKKKKQERHLSPSLALTERPSAPGTGTP